MIIHPDDGRIFIVTGYALIIVLDPITFEIISEKQMDIININEFYSLNAIQWIGTTKFAVAGCDGDSIRPRIHIYSSIDYEEIVD